MRASGTGGGSVRSMRGDERGGSAIEAALLIAAIAVVMLPALFLLGRAVDSAFGKPCEAEELQDRCAVQGAGPGGSSGGSGGGSSAYTANLETRVASEVSNQTGQSSSASCEKQDTPTPPRGTTATCNVQLADGSTAVYQVQWTDDAGTFVVEQV